MVGGIAKAQLRFSYHRLVIKECQEMFKRTFNLVFILNSILTNSVRSSTISFRPTLTSTC